MKKEYEAPEARKVDFDYRENVVASGTQKSWRPAEGEKCIVDDCGNTYEFQPDKWGGWCKPEN